jgi:hypothetical protein
VFLHNGFWLRVVRPLSTPALQGVRHVYWGPAFWLVMTGAWLLILQSGEGAPMTEPTLSELEAERDRLYEQLSRVGDFRRGSVSENRRRCGKPNCACAQPGHPRHGPRMLWTRSGGQGKTVGRQLAAQEVEKVRAELARHAEFTEISRQIVEVNERICEARPVTGPQSPSAPEGEKGGSPPRSQRRGPLR